MAKFGRYNVKIGCWINEIILYAGINGQDRYKERFFAAFRSYFDLQFDSLDVGWADEARKQFRSFLTRNTLIMWSNLDSCVSLQLLKKLSFYSSVNCSSFTHVCTFWIFVLLLVKKLFKKQLKNNFGRLI